MGGILARGSDNAVACAQGYNVPLYTDINQLPHNGINVACVVVRSTVVGGQGTKLANDLLMRGIHVIQEHPVHEQIAYERRNLGFNFIPLTETSLPTGVLRLAS